MNSVIYGLDCLILCCGNPLFGDDGFGPRLAEYMEANFMLPEHAACLDAGTSVRDMLFDLLLMEEKPDRIILVDAVDLPGRCPGEIFEIDPAVMDGHKASDFSFHQFPTTSLLRELREEAGMDVTVLAVQVQEIPGEVQPGLSPALENALPGMGAEIMRRIAPSIRKT
jgi:coenzyme F420 hydrogenase subunit delta